MAAPHSPIGSRRRLGAELRRLRNEAGLTLDEVAEQMTCSTSKISRLETGKGIPKVPDVRELMRIYGVGSRRRAGRAAAAGARRPGARLVGAADRRRAARAVRAGLAGPVRRRWRTTRPRCARSTMTVVHGLLQTEDYARAVQHAVPAAPLRRGDRPAGRAAGQAAGGAAPGRSAAARAGRGDRRGGAAPRRSAGRDDHGRPAAAPPRGGRAAERHRARAAVRRRRAAGARRPLRASWRSRRSSARTSCSSRATPATATWTTQSDVELYQEVHADAVRQRARRERESRDADRPLSARARPRRWARRCRRGSAYRPRRRCIVQLCTCHSASLRPVRRRLPLRRPRGIAIRSELTPGVLRRRERPARRDRVQDQQLLQLGRLRRGRDGAPTAP